MQNFHMACDFLPWWDVLDCIQWCIILIFFVNGRSTFNSLLNGRSAVPQDAIDNIEQKPEIKELFIPPSCTEIIKAIIKMARNKAPKVLTKYLQKSFNMVLNK